jgi:hypothetical protein
MKGHAFTSAQPVARTFAAFPFVRRFNEGVPFVPGTFSQGARP